MSGELWTCRKCNHKFVTKNLWHSCTNATVEDFFEGKDPLLREIYKAFEAAIAECGPYHVSPNKTRIAFMADVRFGGISRASKNGLLVGFALPKKLDHPRIVKTTDYGGGWIGHWLWLRSTSDVDPELKRWLRTSYRLFGKRERLKNKSHVTSK
jgi:hypothetical protein